MAIPLFVTKIPWKEILKYTPMTMDAARKLYDSLKKSRSGRSAASEKSPRDPDARLKSLEEAVKKLEQVDTSQAEIAAQMAEQVGEISTGLRVLAARVTALTLAAVAALLLALASLVMQFVLPGTP